MATDELARPIEFEESRTDCGQCQSDDDQANAAPAQPRFIFRIQVPSLAATSSVRSSNAATYQSP